MTADSTVRRAFGSHASSYEDLIVVQKRVRERIATLCRERIPSPRVVVDLGGGTGALLQRIGDFSPTAMLITLDAAHGMNRIARGAGIRHAVTADAQSIPFRPHVADLVLSTSAFQWLDTLTPAFVEARRILLPGGFFVFSLFAAATLRELRESYREAATLLGRDADRTRTFPTVEGVSSALGESGLLIDSLWTETEEELYSNVPSLIRAIRGIGANTPRRPPSSLGERSVMLRMMEIYERRHGRGGIIPATYEIIYAVVRAPYEPRTRENTIPEGD